MNNKIAFPELVQLIAEATGTTDRMSELFLKELFATMSEALIAGQKVTIKSLGTFETAADSSGHARLSFTPDKALAAAVNQPFAAFESIVLSDDLTDDMLRQIDEGDEAATMSMGLSSPKSGEVSHSDGGVCQLGECRVSPPSSPPEEVESEPEEQPVPEPTPLILNQKESNMKEEQLVEGHTVQHYLKAEHEQEKHKIAHNSFIKGLVTGILSTLALGAIIWGAWNGGRNSVLSDMEPALQADTLADSAMKSSSSPKLGEVSHSDGGVCQSAGAGGGDAVVTDTCTATMYLSRMSVKHYGKPDFWIYIYEENRDKISDPNNAKPGTVVVIPPAAKYGIDASDKASIDRARKRTYELLSN